MTKTARKVKDRIEIRTGVIWGSYRLPDTLMADGKTPQALAYFMFHPKGSSLIRIEVGIGRRGFYLSWGER
jgi:hypothetical protein